jgi:isoquinoline 1-oxidoreductase subunit beta
MRNVPANQGGDPPRRKRWKEHLMVALKLARRTFLVAAGAVAGGLAVGYYYVRRPYENPLAGADENTGVFNPYVAIGSDNTITVIVPRAEMGQGVHTTLAALVAEELDLTLDRIAVEHGPASHVYYNAGMLEDATMFPFYDEGLVAEAVRGGIRPVAKILGVQATGGSSSVRDGFVKMRQAGAAARQMLVAAAAARWEVPAQGLLTYGGEVGDPATGRSVSYGSLALDASRMPLRNAPPLKERRLWKLLGRPLPRVDITAKVSGSAVFGIDVELPDMVYGTIRMCPHFGGKAARMQSESALALPGVLKVVDIRSAWGAGFGVIAENSWLAFKGADALDIEWEQPVDPVDTDTLFDRLYERLAGEADFSLRSDGDVERAFADAPRNEMLEAEYRAPWLAHACMEPMNATARWKGGVLDIWAPNQVPTLIQASAAPLVGLRPEAVRVHTTLLGGGFGRRLETDYALYAVQMARQTEGRPVKVTWRREEDIRHDAYRPAALARMRARVRKRELPVALEISVASQSVAKNYLRRVFPDVPFVGPDKLVTEGAHDQPYRIENYRVSAHIADLPAPVGSWRSVGNSFNAFFHESFVDEIAHASGLDPLGMRLRLMADHPAAIGVLQKVSEMSGWGRDMSDGGGLGLAHTLSFGSWTAQVVEVAATEDGIAIENVWCAVDIGLALDPEIVKAQFMSAIVFGLSAATSQQITFREGAVVESNFTDFVTMRMYQCPNIEVALLESYHKMGGAGEPGTPPSIPALGNAIFAATGKRLRSLPFSSGVDFV